MGFGGIGLGEVALRDAMVAEEQVVVGLSEIGAGTGDEGVDVVGVGIEWLHRFDFQRRREFRDLAVDLGDDGFPARHGVVGVLGEEQQFLDAGGDEAAERVGDGRVAVIHREVDRGVEALLQGGAGELAGDDQGRTLGGPDGGVGVRGIFRAERDDDAVDEDAAEQGGGGSVDDAIVAEEFAQVALHIRDRGGVG